MLPRASTSQAVRYLIQQDFAKRPRDKDGNPMFKAGKHQVRTLNVSTGTTTAQTFGAMVDIFIPIKKRSPK